VLKKIFGNKVGTKLASLAGSLLLGGAIYVSEAGTDYETFKKKYGDGLVAEDVYREVLTAARVLTGSIKREITKDEKGDYGFYEKENEDYRRFPDEILRQIREQEMEEARRLLSTGDTNTDGFVSIEEGKRLALIVKTYPTFSELLKMEGSIQNVAEALANTPEFVLKRIRDYNSFANAYNSAFSGELGKLGRPLLSLIEIERD